MYSVHSWMQTKPKTIDTLLSTCTPQIYRVCYLYLAAVSYHACDTENSYFVHTKLLPSILTFSVLLEESAETK
jgi:hypothetical protein